MDPKTIYLVLLPEIVILIGILLSIAISTSSWKKYSGSVASTCLALAAVLCLNKLIPGLPKDATLLFGASFVEDSMSIFFRLLIYLTSFLISLASSKYIEVLESPAEYYSLLLTATLGAGILTGSNDFLCAFVALETLGLSAILMASYARHNRSSNEAGIKYLISSSVATAMFLMGISWIYGLTATTNLSAIGLKLNHLMAYNVISPDVLILITILLVGVIAFKLAAVPFHNWSPDVYNGAPTNTTLFLSVVSKTAAFALAIRVFYTLFSFGLVRDIFAVLAVASIVLGNYIGLSQLISRRSIKRLLAYSSIAQAGYLMIGLAVLDTSSIASLIVYLTVYALMNTGAFIAAIHFEQITNSDDIYDFAGLINRKPLTTICFSICLINLAGLPFIPAGFIAKFFLFSSAYNSDLIYGKALAIVGLIGSVIALAYYLYLVKIMVVDSPSTVVKQISKSETGSSMKLALALSLILLTGVGLFGTGSLQNLSLDLVKNIFEFRF